MTTATPGYQFPIEVLASDIDHMGHVNNAVYLKWVQDAVISHWKSFAPTEAIERYLWIARGHEIRYHRPGFLGDAIAASLQIESVKGATAAYRTLIEAQGRVLAEVKSLWCCIDAVTRRPIRIPAALAEMVFGTSLGTAGAIADNG
jgi:acyl-CoA thioester hydrolase